MTSRISEIWHPPITLKSYWYTDGRRFSYPLRLPKVALSKADNILMYQCENALDIVEGLWYGDGYIFSALESDPPSLVPGTDRYSNNRTLVYFLLEALFNPDKTSCLENVGPLESRVPLDSTCF